MRILMTLAALACFATASHANPLMGGTVTHADGTMSTYVATDADGDGLPESISVNGMPPVALPPGQQTDVPAGQGRTIRVVVGTNGNDTLQEVTCPFPCAMFGGNGNDDIKGGPHGDSMHGGNGDDDIHGGPAGNDEGWGGDGNDDMGGDGSDDDPGNDNYRGGNGRDKLEGGTGNDRLTGDNGADIMEGGVGDDVIDDSYDEDKASEEKDTIKCGPGADTVITQDNDGKDKIDLGNDTDIDTVTRDPGDSVSNRKGNDVVN